MDGVLAWLGRQTLRPQGGAGRQVCRWLMCGGVAWLRVRTAVSGGRYPLRPRPITYPSATLAAITRIVCLPPDAWASRRTLRMLREMSLAFLSSPLRPGNECVHVPRVRLVEFLDMAAVYSNVEGLTDEVIIGACGTVPGDPVRASVIEMLAGTDQPDLLDALERAFEQAFADARLRFSRPRGELEDRAVGGLRLLWTEGGQPTPFLRILQTNPHLPRQRDPLGEDGHRISRVLLAVMKDLPIPEYSHGRLAPEVVRVLMDGADLPASREFTEACRRALHTLHSANAQDALLDNALSDRGARESMSHVDFLLPSHLAVYLFVTGQWQRYDELDPDGAVLRAYCSVYAAHFYGGHRQEIENAAHRGGRPNPCPPLPLPKARPPVPEARTGLGSSRGSLGPNRITYYTGGSGGGFSGCRGGF